MGKHRRLFSDRQWRAMSGISAAYLVERIRGRGFPARILSDEELGERTA
jgi:hypothetical protein